MVCQHRSCVRSGSDAVLEALRVAAPGVLVAGTACMGQCSSGPTVKVMPDNVWYCQVTVADVEAIATQHLSGNEPVKQLLHPRFHPPETMFTEPGFTEPGR